MTEGKEKERFRRIDALRLYGGDIRKRCNDGSIGSISRDSIYGDDALYRTLNALLFEGNENELERILKEGHKLNSDFIRRIDETVQIYTDIFTLMKEEKPDITDSVIGKRIERVSSLTYYENGLTQSFFSSSKRDYEPEFSHKNGIVLIETEITPNVPYIDFEEILTWEEYKNLAEREILLPPFLVVELKKVPLTAAETKMVKDINRRPPQGKYRIKAIAFPDYRKNIVDPEEALWSKITEGKEMAACLLDKMNEGDIEADYEAYILWKETLQKYLKKQFSRIWYGGTES